ncbi:hypothetical protein [Candidatus Chlorohelix sp.]|uniref:hypothetical protein n=1 Tax=Candidatus Chlorohelix sp. TaxID=3139201 RepID=UPI0030635E63
MLKGSESLKVWVFGPADAEFIHQLAANDPTVTSLFKSGDALILLDFSTKS